MNRIFNIEIDMQRKIWIHKAKTFEEAKAFDQAYYARMTPEERIGEMQRLREKHCKLEGNIPGENRERLRRSVKVIQ